MALITTARVQAAGRGDHRSTSRERQFGVAIAVLGLALATVTLVANIYAGNLVADGQSVSAILPWSFGLTTLAFGTVKLGIAAILVGILVRLYMRIASVKEALPALIPDADGDRRTVLGDYDSPHGRGNGDGQPTQGIAGPHRGSEAVGPDAGHGSDGAGGRVRRQPQLERHRLDHGAGVDPGTPVPG